jgi:ubiquinone/menaquinone biosynthesis C-methylase UbiE
LVLEIGVGSGLNLPLYGSAVDGVCAIDPSLELLHRARRRIADATVPIWMLGTSVKYVPFVDVIFDTVVTTWTLCSIPDPLAALIEMRRVLKPGGHLLFAEHGLASELRIEWWQHRLTPYWKRIAGGCHLDRKIDALIRHTGFQIEALDTGYLKGPKPWTFVYQGSAEIDRQNSAIAQTRNSRQ